MESNRLVQQRFRSFGKEAVYEYLFQYHGREIPVDWDAGFITGPLRWNAWDGISDAEIEAVNSELKKSYGALHADQLARAKKSIEDVRISVSKPLTPEQFEELSSLIAKTKTLLSTPAHQTLFPKSPKIVLSQLLVATLVCVAGAIVLIVIQNAR